MSNNIAVIEVKEKYSEYFKPRIHQISVNLPYDEKDQPNENTIAFFNVYSITRHFGGHEEGGWWYNVMMLEFTVPFIYNRKTVKLMIDSHVGKIVEIPRGDINSVNGGVDALVLIEKTAGESEDRSIPSYS